MQGLDLFGKPSDRRKSSTVCGGFLSIIALIVNFYLKIACWNHHPKKYFRFQSTSDCERIPC